jgi:hypothetical protein
MEETEEDLRELLKQDMRFTIGALDLDVPIVMYFYRDGEVVLDTTSTSEVVIDAMSQVIDKLKEGKED